MEVCMTGLPTYLCPGLRSEEPPLSRLESSPSASPSSSRDVAREGAAGEPSLADDPWSGGGAGAVPLLSTMDCWGLVEGPLSTSSTCANKISFLQGCC